MDGGVLANQASHHIDLLEWFMGPVRAVHARATTALVKIEAEDTAVATLEFCNGALGVIEATNATRPKDLEGSLSVLGETGSVEIGGFAVNKMLHWQFAEARPGDADVLEQYLGQSAERLRLRPPGLLRACRPLPADRFRGTGRRPRRARAASN